MLRNKILLPIGLGMIVLLVSLAAGCKKETPVPPPPPPPKPAAPVPAPVQKQVSSAKTAVGDSSPYDFTKKKDPFKPFVEKKVVRTELPRTPSSRFLPIQNYEVSQFKVSGIIAGFNENKALIVDPAGKAYVVKEGMMIGSNDGRIVKILPTAIEVVENYRDDNDKLKKRSIKLSLPKK